MPKEEEIVSEGVITEALPGGQFRIRLTSEEFAGHLIVGKISGKMRMYHIKIVPGDSVQVTISPYNLEKGIITFRYR